MNRSLLASLVLVFLVVFFIAGYKAGASGWKEKYLSSMAANLRALTIEQGKIRTIESERQAQVDAEREKLNESLRKIKDRDRLIARLRADGLRADLSAFGKASSQSLASCTSGLRIVTDATTECGGLLEEGARLVQNYAREHDERRAALLACVNAWPR